MNNFRFVGSNLKFIFSMLLIILLGAFGIAYALTVSNLATTSTVEIDANITYDTNSNGAEIISTGKMLPISDNLVTGIDVVDSRVLKVKFNVSGLSDNPENTIYDISLHDVDIDCDLRTGYLKWRLYKNSKLLSYGTFSPTFDTMANNRMVLTEEQQDLTVATDEYVFLFWISETCTGDIKECSSNLDQSKYLDKMIKASIKVELSTKTKKKLERVTGDENSCEYISTDVPVCNNLTYSGYNQMLVNAGSNYTLTNSMALNAGVYAVEVKLNDGYKWSNGTLEDKVLICDVAKKDITVTTLDQIVSNASLLSSTLNDVSISGLLIGDRVASVSLSSSINAGTGIISLKNITIVNSNGEVVTSNYNINKNNVGKLTIK